MNYEPFIIIYSDASTWVDMKEKEVFLHVRRSSFKKRQRERKAKRKSIVIHAFSGKRIKFDKKPFTGFGKRCEDERFDSTWITMSKLVLIFPTFKADTLIILNIIITIVSTVTCGLQLMHSFCC